MAELYEKPRRLILELSQNCNLNCIMCGYGGHPIDESKFFDENLLTKIVAEKGFLSDVKEIRLNGRGESTINPRFPILINKISNIFPKAKLSITSNLMFQNEEIVNIFNENNIDLIVSVDSANKDDYESIRKGSNYELLISRLNKIRNCHIIFTLQKRNLDQIESVGKFAVEHQFGFILNVIRVDDPFYKTEFNKLLDEKWDIILHQLKTLHQIIEWDSLFIPDQIWGRKILDNLATTITNWSFPICPNIREELMISYNGLVYPCYMFNPYVLGNIYENSLEEIWNSIKRKEFTRNYRENYYCQKCEYMIHK